MKILSIETSCDDTGISILEVKNTAKNYTFEVLANALSSQTKIHSPYGGVFPSLAKREHIKNLPILLEKILNKCSRQDLAHIDLITVTYGPGLEPALWTGITFAKELGEKYKIPIIPVNHMEGHIFSVFAKNRGIFAIPLLRKSFGGQAKIKFPILSLLVSGGHTELVLMKDWNKYQIIGETLDDAVGEAFDKVARMLELPYPGGPEISKLAEEKRKQKVGHSVLKSIAQADEPSIAIRQQANMHGFQNTMPNFSLPRPMMYSKDFNFSFSGLKTAVLYLIRDLKKENPNILNDIQIKKAIALEFENAAIETLVYKTKKAIEKYKIKTLIVGGGVSANKHLKKEIKKLYKKSKQKPQVGLVAGHKSDLGLNNSIEILFPDKELTGDNSIMIAVAGYFQYIKNEKKIKSSNIKAQGNLRL